MSTPEREVDVTITVAVRASYGNYSFEINQKYDDAGETVREQVNAALTATADLAHQWLSGVSADGGEKQS